MSVTVRSKSGNDKKPKERRQIFTTLNKKNSIKLSQCHPYDIMLGSKLKCLEWVAVAGVDKDCYKRN